MVNIFLYPKKISLILFIFIQLFSTNISAQKNEYAHFILDSLCSPLLHGRGYVYSGDSLASEFILGQLKKHRAQSFDSGYFQYFSIPANTFPDTVDIVYGNKSLKTGVDYIISGDSPSIHGTFSVLKITFSELNPNERIKAILPQDLSSTFLYIDTTQMSDKHKEEIKFLLDFNFTKSAGYIVPKSKLVYVPKISQKAFPVIYLQDSIFNPDISELKIDIHAEYKQKYQTRNVVAFHQGEVDSFIVFTAHYDHLGRLGSNAYFPGAHDNASGVALTLDLARYFSKHKSHYSIAYILFSGEEEGLWGSQVYTAEPFFELSKIKILFNLDMIASGSEGIMLVNGTVYTKYFDLLKKINAEQKLVAAVKKRAPAANSDHYFFYEKGVPSFFIYTLGKEYLQYHNVYDKANAVPLTAYNQLKTLLIEFEKQLAKKSVQ